MIPLSDDNPTSSRPYVTLIILFSCLFIFLIQISLSDVNDRAFIYALGFIPAVTFGYANLPSELIWIPSSLTILSSMFLHGGFFHVASNMLYLWIFADNIEDKIGHKNFFIFYLLCGIVAAMAQALPETTSRIPMIGASGAVSGILGAYLFLYPKAKILVVIPFFIFYTLRLPAFIVLGMWFFGQLFNSMQTNEGEGGVAFRAHVGGFVAGLLLIRFFIKARQKKNKEYYTK
ncbi:MAG: hypothetical protein CBC38_07680 [Gammaproteobacteria bacterium TMED78]|nr:MAG: hypothetical protein CBC38_07680 [Gammaproteobacteria bacterium TMED78]|tara:strand:+ start:14096 stop:14791 length:696 start_codon:yes stop_codon:yes gene_type:complete